MKLPIIAALLLCIPLAAWAQGSGEVDGEHGLHVQSNPPKTPLPSMPPRNTGAPHTCLQYYPKAERDAGIEGITVLTFRITVEGTVKDVTVRTSSGNAALDQASADCVKRFRYLPAEEYGKPVEVSFSFWVKWVLH